MQFIFKHISDIFLFSTGNNLEFSALPHNANKLRGDMPFSAKTQEFNTRKDQIQVLFTGLDDVVFSDAQLDACLTGKKTKKNHE